MPVIELLVLLVLGHLGHMIALQPKLVESRKDCYHGAVSILEVARGEPTIRTCISVGLRITVGFSSIIRDASVAIIKS
jgi:hypothetical protein